MASATWSAERHNCRDRPPVSPQALQQVAATTGGRYYRAKNAAQLQNALGDLPRAITVTHKKIDIAAWFAGLGGLLVAAAVGLSLWWNRQRIQ